jgi:cytochrome P450
VATVDLDERLGRLFAGDADALADPIELYNELRRESPVHEFGGIVIVTRHRDAKEVTRDARRFSNTKGAQSRRGQAFRAELAPADRQAFDEVAAIESKWLTRVGGDEHARLRAAAHRAFTPRRIAELEVIAQAYVDELLADLGGGRDDVVDLMPLAYRVPLAVVCDLLGAPRSDWQQIYGWSRRIAANLGAFRRDTLLDAHAAYREFAAYVDDVLARRGQSGSGSELVAALADAEQDERLTTEELVSMYIVLLFAGHETTTNLIGTGLYELLSAPAQWRALAAEPERARDAVEELLRFVSPIQWNLRQATTATTIGGHPVDAGQDVQVVIASANRDPDVFDDPDELDIGRADVGAHLAFGYGAHFCLGASLARLEGRIALETLARRFPSLELAAEPARWEGSANLRRLARLSVRLGAAA